MKKYNSNSINRNNKYNNVGSGLSPETEEDIERALLGNHVYSTLERISGEWIDGKNTYEKTVILESSETLSSGSLSRFVALEDVGLEEAIDILDVTFYGTNKITKGTVEIDTSHLWVNAINAITCIGFTITYLKNE